MEAKNGVGRACKPRDMLEGLLEIEHGLAVMKAKLLWALTNKARPEPEAVWDEPACMKQLTATVSHLFRVVGFRSVVIEHVDLGKIRPET